MLRNRTAPFRVVHGEPDLVPIGCPVENARHERLGTDLAGDLPALRQRKRERVLGVGSLLLASNVGERPDERILRHIIWISPSATRTEASPAPGHRSRL